MISKLSGRSCFWVSALGLILSGAALAQEPIDSKPHNAGVETMSVDGQIAAALQQVSADRIRANIAKLVSFGTRLTISGQDPESIAAGRGVGAAREWIKSEFERYSKDCGGCLEVKTDSFTEPAADRIPQPTVITNVYAVLKGTDAENAKRIVLVTGHYDSRPSDDLDVKADAPGANDDGSGTAVSLECARVLSKLKFPATIIFLTVAGEEQGLNGSSHYAHVIFISPAHIGVKPVLIFRLDRYLRGGDHYSFNQQGFAAVRFTEFREDFHHQHQNVRVENGIQYGDLEKFVDFDYVAHVARLNAATLASLAAAPAPPANVHLLAKDLENDSTLTWEASPGGLATGYEILWRPTTSPEWEYVQKIGNVTRFTLHLSKDNVIFAVRAVDAQGHQSVPVVPLPER